MLLTDAFDDAAKYKLDLQCEIPSDSLIDWRTSASPIKKMLRIPAEAIIFSFENKQEGVDWKEPLLTHLRIEQIKLAIEPIPKPKIKEFQEKFRGEHTDFFLEELIKAICKELFPIVVGNFADKMALLTAIQNISSQIKERPALLGYASDRLKGEYGTADFADWQNDIILEYFRILVPVITSLVREDSQV
jgi:hypothetical protein